MMNETTFTFHVSRPIDIISMGRVAVDLYSDDIHATLADSTHFSKYLGGCAGNIAVGCARLGLTSMMFSCIGKDEMGTFLRNTLTQENVDTRLLYETKDHLTGLVLLGIDPPDRFPLMFYRNDCADMQLKPAQVRADLFGEAKALLITGTGLSTDSMFETTMHAVKTAIENETAVIIDLDFRPVLWGLTTLGDGESRHKESEAVTLAYQKILPLCQLIVGTEEEICIAGGASDKVQAIQHIRQLTHAPIVVKTGEKGCEVYRQRDNQAMKTKPFPVEIVNVLGAGDGFMSGLLRGLLRGKPWEVATTYANASGALVVTRHGCSPAIPYFDELNYFIDHYDKVPMLWKSETLNQLHQKHHLTKNNNTSLVSHRNGFPDGLTKITTIGEPHDDTGMDFNCLKLRKGEKLDLTSQLESAYLLMTGRVIFHYDTTSKQVERTDYFSEDTIVLHTCTNTKVQIEALTDAELLIIQTENQTRFKPILFEKHNLLESDHRGKGLLNDTSYRIVRTAFDKRNRPESNLVVGEIITFQGSWSSYPPHYHAQPEIYHYRFSEPQGFAFGESGEEVIKIRQYDTYKITKKQTHSHCTAPGYALYTLWFIRHLPDDPYHVPVFCEEHAWTRTKATNKRVWSHEG